MSKRYFQLYKRRIFFIVLISVIFIGCPDYFSADLDSPLDPEAESYQGYETEDSVDALTALTPDGVELSFQVLETSEVLGATYQVQIASSSDFDTVLVYDSADDMPAGFSSHRMPISASLVGKTEYFRRAQALKDGVTGAWTEVRSFTVGNPFASGLSPSDGLSTTDTTPELSWTAVSGADHYEVQIAATEAGVESVPAATTTTATYTPTPALANDSTHYWRVRAVDADGQVTSWSDTISFTVAFDTGISIDPDLGNSFDLTLSGTRSSIGTEDTLTVSMETTTSIDTYTWYLDGTLDATATGSTYTVSVGQAPGNHVVSLIGVSGSAAASAEWEFEVVTDEAAVTRDGLIAEYLFDGDASDSSGNGFDAIENGNVSYSAGRHGLFNSALSLVGTNDYLNCGSSLIPETSLTISLWFRTSSDVHGQTLFSNYIGSSYDGKGCLLCAYNRWNYAIDIERLLRRQRDTHRGYERERGCPAIRLGSLRGGGSVLHAQQCCGAPACRRFNDVGHDSHLVLDSVDDRGPL